MYLGILFFCNLKIFSISSPSPFLNNPVSTKTHFNCLPILLYNNAAVTDESTPPDNAQITFSFLTVFFIFLYELFIKLDIFQFDLHKAIFFTKF